jgi:hypothetical protein
VHFHFRMAGRTHRRPVSRGVEQCSTIPPPW